VITSIFDRFIDTAEKRMRLVRIFYFISTCMMILGLIIIVISLAKPDVLP
jgi:formate-dependent nitrite reductase membrane component NrfD